MAVLVQVLGAVLLVVGVGTFSWRAGIILAGVLLLIGGVLNEDPKPGGVSGPEPSFERRAVP